MKILHLTTHLNTGGITTYLLTLIREQTKAGQEVYVWAGTGTCREAFRACAAKVLDDMPRCKSELSPRLWAQVPRLISFLKKNPVDVIHTHTRVAQVLATAATRFVKVPHVSTAHMFYKKRLGRRLFPCWGQRVMAISQIMRQGLLDIFGEKNLPPIRVVRNGIDVEALRARLERVDRAAVRTAYGYRAEHFVVLSLSRLIPVKGTHILLEAFAAAQESVPEMRLLIAGTGEEDYTRRLKDRVAELGLREKICFLGDVREIEKPLKAADVFAGPYLWPEAFGLSILEAMVAGLPVIGSASGGISDLLDRGKHGLLFEEGNVPALAQRLLDYAKDPELRFKMGQAAGRAALDYSSKKMCEQVQRVYDEVTGGRS